MTQHNRASISPEERALENGPLGVLMGMNPARLIYLTQVLEDELGEELAGTRVLDIGCGFGMLSEPLARRGCKVTGVDASPASIELARRRAAVAKLTIDYHTAKSEELPFADASYDAAICCDVLEHVDDLEQTLSETARILKRDGIFIYSTLNRTFESWLLAIKALQDWSFSRLLPDDLHRWQMFITPRELYSLMAARGLKNRGLTGLRPAASALQILKALRACKRKELTAYEFAKQLKMRPSRNTRVQYLGFAVKK